jgi:hypothetical protein
MEQAHYFARVRINPRQIWAFTQIAVRTGESEIVCIVIPTMLARSNVLYVEAQFGKFLRESAVLTVLARPHADKLAQLDILTPASCRSSVVCPELSIPISQPSSSKASRPASSVHKTQKMAVSTFR